MESKTEPKATTMNPKGAKMCLGTSQHAPLRNRIENDATNMLPALLVGSILESTVDQQTFNNALTNQSQTNIELIPTCFQNGAQTNANTHHKSMAKMALKKERKSLPVKLPLKKSVEWASNSRFSKGSARTSNSF